MSKNRCRSTLKFTLYSVGFSFLFKSTMQRKNSSSLEGVWFSPFIFNEGNHQHEHDSNRKQLVGRLKPSRVLMQLGVSNKLPFHSATSPFPDPVAPWLTNLLVITFTRTQVESPGKTATALRAARRRQTRRKGDSPRSSRPFCTAGTGPGCRWRRACWRRRTPCRPRSSRCIASPAAEDRGQAFPRRSTAASLAPHRGVSGQSLSD